MRPETQVADEVLASNARTGALSDFEELVHRYEGRIFRFVANRFKNQADAQEVTQEIFVTAYLNLGKFDVQRSFVTWLFTIARRKCIDRRRTARPPVENRIPELPDVNDPSSLLAEREAAQQLWDTARRTLPELQFHALWLKYAEAMSVEAIARVLRRTKIHVKVLLFRARTRLAQELECQRAKEQGGETTYTSPRLLVTLEGPKARTTRPPQRERTARKLLNAET